MDPGHLAALAPARVRDATLFVGGLAFAVVLHVADPSEGTSFPVCPFYAATGLYCPGCGTLRCLHALLHADLRSAIDFNLMTVLLVPMLVAVWLSVGLAGISAGGVHPMFGAPLGGRGGRRCRVRTLLGPAERARRALLVAGSLTCRPEHRREPC